MAQNKHSIWSIIILIATIISLVLLVVGIVTFSIGLPAITEEAKQAAADAGATGAEIDLAVGLAVGAVVVALVFASIFDILKIIGGFMFSLKGRWGLFCIIVSLISVAMAVWSLASNISNHAGVATIVTTSIDIAVSALLCVACFKHRAELK